MRIRFIYVKIGTFVYISKNSLRLRVHEKPGLIAWLFLLDMEWRGE